MPSTFGYISSAKTAQQLHNYDMPFHLLWRLMDNVNTRRQVFCSLFKLIALVPCKRVKSSASSILYVVGFYQCLCCVLTFSCSIAVFRWWFCFQEKEASWLSFSGSHWYWGYGVLFNYRALLLLYVCISSTSIQTYIKQKNTSLSPKTNTTFIKKKMFLQTMK